MSQLYRNAVLPSTFGQSTWQICPFNLYPSMIKCKFSILFYSTQNKNRIYWVFVKIFLYCLDILSVKEIISLQKPILIKSLYSEHETLWRVKYFLKIVFFQSKLMNQCVKNVLPKMLFIIQVVGKMTYQMLAISLKTILTFFRTVLKYLISYKSGK